jgi:hypothetical protein
MKAEWKMTIRKFLKMLKIFKKARKQSRSGTKSVEREKMGMNDN